jgi:adenosylcobyric acid synthase
VDILAHHRAGLPVFGICGGYQMLGKTIADPDGLEGSPGTSEGLGLLEVDTVLAPTKHLGLASGRDAAMGTELSGYHMHMGETVGPACASPFAVIGNRPEGAQSADGLVTGTYLHGVFAADAFRSAFLARRGAEVSALAYEAGIEKTLDALADHLEADLDLDALLALAQPVARR